MAEALSVNGSMTKISLERNKLEEAGTKAICNALKSNNTLKELNLAGWSNASNIGGIAGARHVADMLSVNGSITSVR